MEQNAVGLLVVLASAKLGVVLVLRKVGARFLPWLGTPKGAVLLAVVGGTATMLAVWAFCSPAS